MIKDALDEKILRELRWDARISNAELGARVNLSPSACLRRVQELERRGVIKGYRTVIDPEAGGHKLVVFVMVGLSGHLRKDALAFEQAMEAAPQVQECHNISGNVEYLLRVEVGDLTAFKTFHADILGVLPMVASINSHFCLGSSKDAR